MGHRHARRIVVGPVVVPSRDRCRDRGGHVAGGPGASGGEPRHRLRLSRHAGRLEPGNRFRIGRDLGPGGSRTARPGHLRPRPAANFSNEAGALGGIRFLKNVVGLWILEQCRQAWGGPPIEILLEEAASIEDVVPTFDAGNHRFVSPADMVREVQDAADLPPGTPRSVIARSVIESIVTGIGAVVEELEQITERRQARIAVVGGGARVPLLHELLNRRTGLRVVKGSQEATALGNAIVQGWPWVSSVGSTRRGIGRERATPWVGWGRVNSQMESVRARQPAAECRSAAQWGGGVNRRTFTSPEERLGEVKDLISERGAVRIDQLAADFGVSEMTIRRDLDELEALGIARRVRGGAIALGPEPFAQRHRHNARAKGRIAEKLIDLIPAVGTVAFDASTTVHRLAASLEMARDSSS